jgi:hypothetical protein
MLLSLQWIDLHVKIVYQNCIEITFSSNLAHIPHRSLIREISVLIRILLIYEIDQKHRLIILFINYEL